MLDLERIKARASAATKGLARTDALVLVAEVERLREICEYIYGQAPGHELLEEMPDTLMVRVYLSADVLRKLAGLLKESS